MLVIPLFTTGSSDEAVLWKLTVKFWVMFLLLLTLLLLRPHPNGIKPKTQSRSPKSDENKHQSLKPEKMFYTTPAKTKTRPRAERCGLPAGEIPACLLVL